MLLRRGNNHLFGVREMSEVAWAPKTEPGFMPREVPRTVRRIVPSRFSLHLFVPMADTGEAKAILTVSRPRKDGSHIHVSAVVSQEELGKQAPVLYERFILPATTAIDDRFKEMV